MKYILIFLILFSSGCLQSNNTKGYSIEINSVPPPFDLNGHAPYVLWINGKKVDLPKEDLLALVNKVGVEKIPKINPLDIHKGWLWSHFVQREEFPE